MVPVERIRRLPKVLLHDHLDGGLRPATIVELADACGYDALPTRDPDALAARIRAQADSGSLVSYLEAFTHAVGVLQTPEALERVAAECGADLAADGVVRAEVRMAPELCTRRGLALDDVIEAVLAGFARARAAHGLRLGLIVCGMREGPHVRAAAEAAVRWRDHGVVGFDLAGPERAHPPEPHAEAFALARREGLGITVHAGESAGLDSIRGALEACGAQRLGHGVRITDDIDDGDPPRLGSLAAAVRDRGVPLEVCPTSNVHTAAAPSIADHPFGLLHRLGFRVTVNTDNRLMSAVTLSDELAALSEAFHLDLGALEAAQVAAAESLFAPAAERRSLVDDVVRPAFGALARGGAA